ncbi:serum response factor-binding protein 1 [Oncorhynchus kisutch]|uniref:serum response factor-binding protein 1 n=1 Tax=Oncorhynchus kisutch TaxID=8019 RepID=UPI0012DC5116|nr:serum response factor-binding protein 1 [Oncorhynchus kisutch]XP_031650900.1 serum response factor-binding protein 1 [Oncorhynchus kisutch]
MSSTDTQQVTMPDVLKTEAIPEDPNKQKMSELPKDDNKPVLLIKDKKTAAQKKKKKPEIPRRKKKKPDDSGKPVPLNLNDEVVRMRKEVKRVRALVIRKLTRQMAGLKKKKGKEEDLERNRRRVGRLLEEIHAMKTLKPDPVTKAALHKNLSFEFVCKNPKATISDRAIARIATHPQFSKKIDTIKAAIKAFKDERMSVEKGDQKETVRKQPLKVVEVIEQPRDSDGGGGVEGEEGDEEEEGTPADEEEEGTPADEEEEGTPADEEEDGTPADEEEEGTPAESLAVDEPAVLEKQPVDKTVRVTEEDDVSTIETKESAIENTVADPQPTEMSEADKTLLDSSTPFTIEAPQVVPTKNIVTMKNTPQKQVVQKLTKDTPVTQKTQDPKPQKVTKPQNKDVKNKQDDEEDSDDDHEEEESDLESSDDEKEYFDDSTEERFRKQSSQSDESDNDDFFLGKVNKFKKKSDTTTAPPGGGEGKSSELGKNPLLEPLESLNPHQTELDELEARLNSKGKSIFCSSLSGSRGGRGRGRGAGRGMGRGGGRGGDFKNHGRGGDDGPSRGPRSHDGGSGRGRGHFGRQREGRGFSSTPSSQPPQQALHPSWEASKKRKEQQTVVVAFQGKKIKFDD